MSNVLIIEDDVYLADDLKFFIEEEKHSCQVYNKADEVIENIDNFAQFYWIILDIMMLKGNIIQDDNPDIETGEILYQMIRKRYPKMKFLVLSAKDFKDMHIKIDKELNVVTMLKPVTEDKLKKILEIVSD